MFKGSEFKRVPFAPAVIFVVALSALPPTPTRAAFVNGVETFSGTTFDLDTWEAYPPLIFGAISQSNGLTVNSNNSLTLADYTTRQPLVRVGDRVRVGVRMNSVNHTFGGTATLYLTTNSNGPDRSTNIDSHYIAINSLSNGIVTLDGGAGSGGGQFITQTRQPLGRDYGFEIERLTDRSARFTVYDETGRVVGSRVEALSPFADPLHVSLYTQVASATFTGVIITPVPEPAAAAGVFMSAVLLFLRRRRRP